MSDEIRPEYGPLVPLLFATGPWNDNGEMMADLMLLYGSDDPDAVWTIDPRLEWCDATYGLGVFWKHRRPKLLVCHDLDPAKGDGVDARNLPERDNTYDRFVLDLPYMPSGGKSKTMGAEYLSRFGRTHDSKPEHVQASVAMALVEARRVTRPGGLVFVKAADFHWWHEYIPASHWTFDAAIGLGFELVDKAVFGRTGGIPQPQRNRDGSIRHQRTLRRTESTMFIFRNSKAAA